MGLPDPPAPGPSRLRVYSVGHGTRSIEELAATLDSGGVRCLVDVRGHPGSRRHPQFGQAALAVSLPSAGVEYLWMGPRLGGRRRLDRSRPSPNPAWEVEAFRAYADYTDSPEFQRGIEELLAVAARAPTAFMCAERHWSQCHRRIIADKLWSLGHEVVHLITPERHEPHRAPPFLRVEGALLRYDRGVSLELELGG